jgi:hypothetical protein
VSAIPSGLSVALAFPASHLASYGYRACTGYLEYLFLEIDSLSEIGYIFTRISVADDSREREH